MYERVDLGDPDGTPIPMQNRFPLLVPGKLLEMLSWNGEVNPFELKYHDGLSLRQLAGKFGVSHETVRRTLSVVHV